MRRVILLAALAVPVFASTTVKCPEHNYATCFDTQEARIAADGGMLHKWHCSCGDDWWVRQ